MTGLQEKNIKLRDKNKRKLERCPYYVVNWYNYLRSSNISENTCGDYINKVCKFLEFLDEDIKNIEITDISLQDVINYMASKMEINGIKNSSDSYKQCIWSALNNFFEYCLKSGLIHQNYMKDIKRAKNKDLERIKKNRIRLKEEDYINIINNIKNGVGTKKAKKMQEEMINRNVAIFMILITTGIRKSALCQINIGDLDIINRSLFVVDKNEKSIEYYLSEDTLKYIQLWLEDRNEIRNESDALFITSKGSRISNSALDKLVDKYSTPVVGKHMSPHKFRGGFVSSVFDKTGNIEFTRRAVGHSNISTTQRYITTENKEQEKAANIMNQIFK